MEFIPELAWWGWLVAALVVLALYLVITVVLGFLLDDHVSEKASTRWFYTFGIGLIGLILILQPVVELRDKFFCWQRFGFWPARDIEVRSQQLTVDARLRDKAIYLDLLFSEQDELNRFRDRNPKRVEESAAKVLRAKRDFWRDHGTARRCGFTTRGSYRKYA